jgi:hypothetical protein
VLVTIFAALGGAMPASAAEADPSTPALCSPPCLAGQTCVGGTCMVPANQAATPPAPPTSSTPPGTPGNATPPQPGSPPPQPGYPYAPGSPPPQVYSYPPPGYAPPRRLRRKRGFLMMPFLGIHSYQHQEAYNTDPGLRVGTFVGGRINDIFSANAEVRLDVTNPGDLPAGTESGEWAFTATFSPLFQLPAGPVEFVLGPKVGGFYVNQRLSDTTDRVLIEGYGVVIGGNIGVFVPVSPTASLGLLLSLEIAKLSTACVNVTGAGSSCNSDVDAPASQILGLTAAALF